MKEKSKMKKEKSNIKIKMLNLFFFLFSLFFFISCNRKDNPTTENLVNTQYSGAYPLAILQTGEYPIWFQLTNTHPIHIESIEDAIETCAFVPWPLALHVRFFYEKDDSIVMAINRDGFLKIKPEDQGLAMYHFSGGDFWKQYTVGGFVNYNDQDVALLYLDDRFLETENPLPNPRTFSFNMNSNNIFSVSVPALDIFPIEDGWNADTLRKGDDGYWYFRVNKASMQRGEIHMIKTVNLSQAGISISAEDFFTSSFKQANEMQNTILSLLEFLPSLPEGFVYTQVAFVNDSIFACWEEQDSFSIGAAGFMLIKK